MVLDYFSALPYPFEYRAHKWYVIIYYLIKVDSAGGGDVALLQEDLIDVMPAVEEANSISEELDKRDYPFQLI